MSVEARLQALVQNYRAQHGDAGLHASPQLIAQLSSQAPDLYGEIRALAAVITSNGLARIAASPDQDGEAQRVATEIAGSEKLSMAVAAAGVAVARTLGPVGGAAAPTMPPAPTADVGGWAGETMIAPGAAPAPQAPPAAPQQPYGQAPGYAPTAGYVPPGSVAPPGPGGSTPIYKNKVVLGVVAAVVLFLGYAYTQRDRPTPQPQPTSNGQQGPIAGGAPQNGPPQSGPGGNQPQNGGQRGTPGEYPMLATTAPGPALQVNRMENGYAIPFLIQVDGVPTPGGVIVPLNGWNQGPTTVVFGSPNDTRGTGQIVNTGTAQMQLTQGQNGPVRMGQIQWQRDQLNLGPICISFQGNGQSQSGDVGMSGTTMCVMSANCQQNAGCGTIR